MKSETRQHRLLRARAQLSIVEHALCPLDAAQAMRANVTFATRYYYTDTNRNRRSADVSVAAVHGMSPHDELYLWGLLALALSQPEPAADFYATPYYCLKRLGVVSSTKRGGREFELFREAIRRLAGVRYENSAFYDPIRGEHRDVAFGFLNYSLPLAADSSRAWRFAWDPIFFELARATGGALSFDLSLFRELDAATRRLYLWLKKVMWRREASPRIDLRHLAVDVLGFADGIETSHLRRKTARCIENLLDHSIIAVPDGCHRPVDAFTKNAPGVYTLQVMPGAEFARQLAPECVQPEDSPIFDVLRSIGFGDAEIVSLLRNYKVGLLERWADITLAARERNGDSFFTTSPQAYFIDNVKAACSGTRTEPDWWRDMRRQEQQQERDQQQAKRLTLRQHDEGFEEYLEKEACEAFAKVTSRLVQDYTAAGQSHAEAQASANDAARMHFRNRFRQEHGFCSGDEPTALSELLPFNRS